jgi:hypothetical protein
MAAALGPCIQEAHAMVGQRHLARQWYLATPDEPHVGDGVMRGADGRVVTTAVRAPVRPATLWMRVVSRTSARRSAGRNGSIHTRYLTEDCT